MKKQVDRIVLIANICLSALFVIIAVLTFSNIITLNIVEGALVVDGYLFTIIVFMAVLYVLTAGYLVISFFNDNTYLKQILLYSDHESQTQVNMASLRKIAVNQCKQVQGLKLKKLRIALTDSKKLRMIVEVNAKTDEVTTQVDTLRCLLAESYNKLLALKFDLIDININKIATNYKADLDNATKQAHALMANREVTDEVYDNPLEEVCDEHKTETLKQSEAVEAEMVEEIPSFGTPKNDVNDDIVVEITDDATAGDGSSEDHMQVDLEEMPNLEPVVEVKTKPARKGKRKE